MLKFLERFNNSQHGAGLYSLCGDTVREITWSPLLMYVFAVGLWQVFQERRYVFFEIGSKKKSWVPAANRFKYTAWLVRLTWYCNYVYIE